MIRHGLRLLRIKSAALLSTKYLPRKLDLVLACLKLTENCQSRCVTCGYWQQKWEDRISTYRAISLINDEIPALGIRNLRFTGGEPLLRKDFFDILGKMQSSLYKNIILQTNGLLIKRYADQINDSPINKLTVSLDGLSKTNDRIRGTKNGWEKVFDGLSMIHGKTIAICSTLTNRSHLEYEEFLRFIKERGYQWEFNLLDNTLYHYQDIDIKEISNFSDQNVDKLIAILRKTDSFTSKELEYVNRFLKKETSLGDFFCFLGYYMVFINSAGNVFSGCYVLPPLGNILDKPLHKIISSEEYHNQVRRMFVKKCPGCTCGFAHNIKLHNLFDTASFILKKRVVSAAFPFSRKGRN